MNNKKNVKRIPKFWKYLPFLETGMASSIYPNIYLPDKEYNDWSSSNVSILTKSILIHENVHLENWEKIGFFKFSFLYLVSKSFRLTHELKSIKEQMKFLKENNLIYDIERKARHFAGKEYFYLLKIDKAREILSNLWNSI